MAKVMLTVNGERHDVDVSTGSGTTSTFPPRCRSCGFSAMSSG
jgi:hypothetical protein